MSRSRIKSPLKLTANPMARTREGIEKRIIHDITTLIIDNPQAFSLSERLLALEGIIIHCSAQCKRDLNELREIRAAKRTVEEGTP